MTNEFKPKDIYDWSPEEIRQGKLYAKSIGVNFYDWLETFMSVTPESILKSMEARKVSKHQFKTMTKEDEAAVRKHYEENLAHLSEEDFLLAVDAMLNEVD